MRLSDDEVTSVLVAHKALVALKVKFCDHRCDICPFVSHNQGPGVCTLIEPKERLQMLIRSHKAKMNDNDSQKEVE